MNGRGLEAEDKRRRTKDRGRKAEHGLRNSKGDELKGGRRSFAEGELMILGKKCSCLSAMEELKDHVSSFARGSFPD